MALLTPTQVSRSGTNRNTPFVAPGAAGDRFINDGRTTAAFKNTSGSSVTVTFAIGATIDGQVVAGRTCVIPATTGDIETDNFPAEYNNADGEVNWTYSATPAGLTVAAFRRSKVSV
ncbi:MAG: hypothetical protein LC778_10265 [Acidobacteria bacterium]|nr:hypothetical protein [Acidobacteriota bacterium]